MGVGDNVGVMTTARPLDLSAVVGQLQALKPKSSNRKPDRRGASLKSFQGLVGRLSRGEAERRNFRDRRATPRVNVELECEEQQGGSRYVRLTRDLSTFGLSTLEGHTPKKGTKLKLKLFLPDEPNAPLALEAEVLGACRPSGGMRLKFSSPPLEAVRRIHRFLVKG